MQLEADQVVATDRGWSPTSQIVFSCREKGAAGEQRIASCGWREPRRAAALQRLYGGAATHIGPERGSRGQNGFIENAP